MPTVHLLWDASAVAKRYAPEVGSDIVEALFQQSPVLRPVLSVPGYAEIVALLQRKKNSGMIAAATFQTAVSSLQTDFLMNPDAVLLTITDAIVFASIPLIEQYNINSSDAAILTAFNAYRLTTREKTLLVASDKRLIRAAQTEGLAVLDPEQIVLSDLSTRLANL